MKPTSLIILALLVSVAGCGSPTAIEEEVGTIGPAITGIRATSPEGPNQVVAWGSPSCSNPTIAVSSGGSGQVTESPSSDLFYNPFPNPSRGSVTLRFTVMKSQTIRVSIARMQLLSDVNFEEMRTKGIEVDEDKLVLVRRLMHGKLVPGGHLLQWDGTDNSGVAVPPGVYRIYLQRGTQTEWHDIIVYGGPAELPSNLRTLVESWG